MNNIERADQLIDSTISVVKNTIGYHESKDKKEFEKGMKMFRDKLKIHLIKLYEDLNSCQKRSDERISRVNNVIKEFKRLFEGV